MSGTNGACGYIHDGYTRRGYCEAVEHLSPAVRFTYRPMRLQARSVVYRQIETMNIDDPAKAEMIAARSIQNQLVDWDLKKSDGMDVAIRIDEIKNVEPNLQVDIFKIITGVRVTDEDPAWSAGDKAERMEQELSRALGDSSSTSEEEGEAKN